jgi:hypothetical protein
MRNPRFSFRPEYSGSRALVIGINHYQHASPLSYAVNDAEAVAALLKSDLDFPAENITLLLEQDATKQRIMDSFLGFASDEVEPNERILVFFAGHGCTRSGNRGETGFLVPHDGNKQNLSTLIRWDDFTRGAEHIAAKHMLFIMDACYGGLAITRLLAPGSVRYLKDLLNRYTRQALAAGKADQEVADGGGPIPGHSVFTGHLLEALAGKAADKDGVLTANGLMTYVCQKVGADSHSRQTPHYGFLDGDGDFIFKAPLLETLEENDQVNIDTLITLPSADVIPNKGALQEKIVTTKRLLSDDTAVIELHDFIVQEIREFLVSTGEDHFKIDGVNFSQDEFLERISKYETRIEPLAAISACMTYWAKPSHHQILRKMIARVTDRLESRSGLIAWSYLRWYPVIIQLYAAGIAAVEGKRYDSLATIFYTKIKLSDYEDKQNTFVESVADAILQYNRINLFKQLPGHERHYTPLSEYLHKHLQPMLDDILFLGKSYEASFDEFEVLLALAVACIRKRNDKHVWGPVGRFGWKYGSRGETNPFTTVVAAAKQEKENWPPLKAGLFDGNYDTFVEAASEYEQMLGGLHWR